MSHRPITAPQDVRGRAYSKPELEYLGTLLDVTLKSGVNPDSNHPDRPKKGGGHG